MNNKQDTLERINRISGLVSGPTDSREGKKEDAVARKMVRAIAKHLPDSRYQTRNSADVHEVLGVLSRTTHTMFPVINLIDDLEVCLKEVPIVNSMIGETKEKSTVHQLYRKSPDRIHLVLDPIFSQKDCVFVVGFCEIQCFTSGSLFSGLWLEANWFRYMSMTGRHALMLNEVKVRDHNYIVIAAPLTSFVTLSE